MKSKNSRIFRDILSKIRQSEITSDMSYIIVYAFFYKYCSDLLKDYCLDSLSQKEMTLDEAYDDEDEKFLLKLDADNMFGYFITSPEFYIDEVINENYSNRFFIYEFVKALSDNVEFCEGSNYEKYFRVIFDVFSSEVNLNKFEFEGESHLIVKEIIFAISKLDIFEDKFPFQKVFNQLSQHPALGIKHDPEYINSIISAIVNSNKENVSRAYNPFLNDASSLIDIMQSYSIAVKTYGKCYDKLTYVSSIVRFFINFFDLDGVFLDLDSPIEPMVNMNENFDVIISRLPPITPRNIKRLNKNESLEIAKQKKLKEIEEILIDTLNIDKNSFDSDAELQNTAKALMKKSEVSQKEALSFTGEYEVLYDSDYLFLINLIESLMDDGIMVLAMSQSFLFKNNLRTLRKYLTYEKNYIDAIISVPDGLSRPKRSEIVVVFRKIKQTDDIVFIDMSTDFNLKPLEMAPHGFVRKTRRLDDETHAKIVKTYNGRIKTDKYSNVVGIDEIAQNEFNLSVSRYVDTFEGEFVKLENLKNEKKEITSNIKRLNKKIDEMMDDLGLNF